jgi:thiamine-phosphate pyrophosphorylase
VRQWCNCGRSTPSTAEADGVHLGQDDLPPGRLPVEARAALLVGRSTHSEAEVESAADEPVDYVAFGPVFGTRSKDSPYPAPGTRGLAHAVQVSRPRPVVAIGGIDASNAGQAIAAGAAGIAVISAVAGASDPVEATRSLVRCLRDAAP